MDPIKTVAICCAGCGAGLQISPELDRFVCGYCGMALQVKRHGGTVSLMAVTDSIKKVQAGTDRTAAELALVRLNSELTSSQEELVRVLGMMHSTLHEYIQENNFDSGWLIRLQGKKTEFIQDVFKPFYIENQSILDQINLNKDVANGISCELPNKAIPQKKSFSEIELAAEMYFCPQEFPCSYDSQRLGYRIHAAAQKRIPGFLLVVAFLLFGFGFAACLGNYWLLGITCIIFSTYYYRSRLNKNVNSIVTESTGVLVKNSNSSFGIDGVVLNKLRSGPITKSLLPVGTVEVNLGH